jgi:hypothetical protein
VDTPTLLSVAQFSEKHPAFPIGGLRHLIFYADENGLAKSDAIIRIGRKVLIAQFFDWIINRRADRSANSKTADIEAARLASLSAQ